MLLVSFYNMDTDNVTEDMALDYKEYIGLLKSDNVIILKSRWL